MRKKVSHPNHEKTNHPVNKRGKKQIGISPKKINK